MAENTPLSTVLQMLKGELGYNLSSTQNTAEDQRLYQLIDSQQKWLADEWDWPTLDEWWDVPVAQGTRFPALPSVDGVGTTIAFNKRRSLKVYTKWNNAWLELQYGIQESEQYNNIDSDLGQTSDPIQRWSYSDTTAFEVWPLPATAQTVRFRGQRVVNTLKNGASFDPTKTLDLDDLMVVLFCAGNHFIQNENPLGKTKLEAAVRQLNRVRAQEPRYEKRFIMGGNADKELVKTMPIKIIATH